MARPNSTHASRWPKITRSRSLGLLVEQSNLYDDFVPSAAPIPSLGCNNGSGQNPVLSMASCGLEGKYAFCDQTLFTEAEEQPPPPGSGGAKSGVGLPGGVDYSGSGYVCAETCPGDAPYGAPCATNTGTVTWTPGTPAAQQVYAAAGPTPLWRCPDFAAAMLLPNNGSLVGQVDLSYCSPITPPGAAAACAY